MTSSLGYEWHVVACVYAKWQHVRAALFLLDCVTETLAPSRVETLIVRNRIIERSVPWLGPLVLARWATDDPVAWHDVANVSGVLPSGIVGGWPPATVPQSQVDRLLAEITRKNDGGVEVEPPPCQRGDMVRFTHLAWYRLVARCDWVSDAQVGLRLGFLGRDVIIPVPYSAIERRQKVDAAQYGRVKNRFTNGVGYSKRRLGGDF